MAELTGTDPKQIRRHENAEHDISSCTLIQYAEALGASPLALLPDRFSKEDTSQIMEICRMMQGLSDESLRMIQDIAKRMKALENGAAS